MKINFTLVGYGFWDLSGRNLFFKFPKFTFIEITDKDNLDIDDTSTIDLSLGDPLADALKSQKRKIYIKTNADEIENDLNKIVRILPSYLLRNGKYVDGAVELLEEIIIGVDKNPGLQKTILLKRLKSDTSLSRYNREDGLK